MTALNGDGRGIRRSLSLPAEDDSGSTFVRWIVATFGVFAILGIVVIVLLLPTLREPKAIRLARELIGAKAFQQAIEVLQSDLEQDPTNAEAALLLGQCYLSLDDAPNTAKFLRQSYLLDPTKGKRAARLCLEKVAEHLEKEQPYRTYANLAVELDPAAREEVTWTALSAARAALKQGNLARAARLAQEVGDEQPLARSEAANILADIAVSLAQGDAKKQDVLALARAAAEWDPRLRPRLVERLLGVSDPSLAGGSQRDWLMGLVQLDPSARGDIASWLLKSAEAQVNAGQLAGGASAAAFALEMAPSLRAQAADLYWTAARKLLDQGQVGAETEAYLRRCWQLNPTLADRLASACVAQAKRQGRWGDTNAQEKLLAWAMGFDPRVGDEAARVYETMMHKALDAERYDDAQRHAASAIQAAAGAKVPLGMALEAKALALADAGLKTPATRLLCMARDLGCELSQKGKALLTSAGEGLSPTPIEWIRDPDAVIGRGGWDSGCRWHTVKEMRVTFRGEEIVLTTQRERGHDIAAVCSRGKYRDFELEYEFEFTPGSHWKAFCIDLPTSPEATDFTETGYIVPDKIYAHETCPGRVLPGAQFVPWKSSGLGPYRGRLRRVSGRVTLSVYGQEEKSVEFQMPVNPDAPRHIRLRAWNSEVIIRKLAIRSLSRDQALAGKPLGVVRDPREMLHRARAIWEAIERTVPDELTDVAAEQVTPMLREFEEKHGATELFAQVSGRVALLWTRVEAISRQRRPQAAARFPMQMIRDPEGNLEGDATRRYMDVVGTSVARANGRYILSVVTATSFPTAKDMEGGKRVDFIWFMDIDRRTDTGQSASGNDYNIHLWMDQEGWHESFYKVSDVAMAHRADIRPEGFRIEARGNAASLSFPDTYFPSHHFCWWLHVSSLNAPNWVPFTQNPSTERAEFGPFTPLPKQGASVLPHPLVAEGLFMGQPEVMPDAGDWKVLQTMRVPGLKLDLGPVREAIGPRGTLVGNWLMWSREPSWYPLKPPARLLPRQGGLSPRGTMKAGRLATSLPGRGTTPGSFPARRLRLAQGGARSSQE